MEVNFLHEIFLQLKFQLSYSLISSQVEQNSLVQISVKVNGKTNKTTLDFDVKSLREISFCSQL
jgi:hypothetical protein